MSKKVLKEIWRQIQGAHMNAHCEGTGNRGVAYFGPDEIDLLWDIVQAFEDASLPKGQSGECIVIDDLVCLGDEND